MKKPKLYRGETATDIWEGGVRWHLEQKLDHVSGIACNLNDVYFQAESLEYDFNLQEVWLNKARWTKLIRDYLDPEETAAFVQRARQLLEGKGKSGSLTEMAFRRNKRQDHKHRWGNCLIGCVFRGYSEGSIDPTLTFYSRVSYNGYIFGLDLAIANILAREISEGYPETIRFQWVLNVLSLHPFKTLPYIYTQPDLTAQMEENKEKMTKDLSATWREIMKWQRKIEQFHREGKTLEEEKYGAFKRIRRRYEESLEGILVPSVHVSELTLDKLEGYNL